MCAFAVWEAKRVHYGYVLFCCFFTVSELPLKTIYFEMQKNSDTRLKKKNVQDKSEQLWEWIHLSLLTTFLPFQTRRFCSGFLKSSVKVWNYHYGKQVSVLVVMREYNIHYNQIMQSYSAVTLISHSPECAAGEEAGERLLKVGQMSFSAQNDLPDDFCNLHHPDPSDVCWYIMFSPIVLVPRCLFWERFWGRAK